MIKNQNSKSGFTIIEVVLVLAIAGLIFLMVFVALPALQRNQRDAQRKRQIATFKDSLMRAKTNGDKPHAYGFYGNSSVKQMVDRGYLKEDEMKDPSTGLIYGVSSDSANNNFWFFDGGENGIEPGQYLTIIGSDCENSYEDRWNMNKYDSTAFWFGMEVGPPYCVDIDGRYQGNTSISV